MSMLLHVYTTRINSVITNQGRSRSISTAT